MQVLIFGALGLKMPIHAPPPWFREELMQARIGLEMSRRLWSGKWGRGAFFPWV